MSSARITYSSHPDTTSDIEVNALAAVYYFILRNHPRGDFGNLAPDKEVINVKPRDNDTSRVSHHQLKKGN